jgi:predicted nucleic acid-binding Zn ribbon protein
VGRTQCPHALVPGQPSPSRRWHPGCRRCLLKGCERWFLPRRPQARYCSPACQDAARRWRRWLAGQRYRASPNGQQRRRDQARRSRDRRRQRSALPESDPPTPHVDPTPPTVEAQSPPPIDPPSAVSGPSVGQRPAETPEKSSGLPCHRPGCYVLFLPSPRSPDQRFCSGSCRQALRRVRQREARLRLRRRRGGRPQCRAHRGPPQPSSVMSSRIEDARL